MADIVYADDTLLLATCDGHLQEFLSRKSLMLENHRVWNFIGTSSNYFQFNAELAFARRVGNTSSPGTNYLGAVVTHTEVCLDTSLVAASGWQKQVLLICKSLEALLPSCSSEGLYLQNAG